MARMIPNTRDLHGFHRAHPPHRLVRTVKLADIEANLNVLRLAALAPADLRRVEKYHWAWHRLNSAEGEAA